MESICAKANKRLYVMRLLKRGGASPEDLRTVYCCFVWPILEYACPVWHTSLTVLLYNELEQIQRKPLESFYLTSPIMIDFLNYALSLRAKGEKTYVVCFLSLFYDLRVISMTSCLLQRNIRTLLGTLEHYHL